MHYRKIQALLALVSKMCRKYHIFFALAPFMAISLAGGEPRKVRHHHALKHIFFIIVFNIIWSL